MFKFYSFIIHGFWSRQ
uniref:Uncharacterized protein n=1 Tax=Anguilla anguilla TaxID=7936 RepID=A0A0E9STC2_ANGAN